MAQNATTAQTANDANALGGIPASSYAQRFFAKVQYNGALPVILAGSSGVTAEPEGALGFPRIRFPRSMDNCAVIATTSAAAGTSIVRHSSNSVGTLVQLAIQDGANAPLA
jgi:hypothetical protein